MVISRWVLFTAVGAALCAAPRPVWIDTDPSAMPGGHEVDDAVALVQAFGSPEIAIRGISITYGNTDLVTAGRIGRSLVKEFGPASLNVFDGAASGADLGKETEATKALRAALQRERLTVVVLGPATNVATALMLHPELAKRMVEVVAVAGRRPGQHFQSGPQQAKPFRDLNFELDPKAFQVLLDARVPLVLAPWEISSKVWLTRQDVSELVKSRPALKSLEPALLDWLDRWKSQFGTEGFNPFDALAVGYVVDPRHITCLQAPVRIEPGPSDTGPGEKPFLTITPGLTAAMPVSYCYSAASGFKADLLRRIRGTH